MATTIVSHGVERGSSGEMTAALASRYAWWTWLTLLLVPFIFFLFVAYQLMGDMTASDMHGTANTWFIATMAYLAIIVPASIFWRSHVFRAYWHGDVVSPRSYLVGMISVWVAIEIGGLAAMVGCLVSNSLLPCMLPAIVAFMFFVPMWPSGHAMVRANVGNAEDPERYEEPG